jgi:hypothetical protein
MKTSISFASLIFLVLTAIGAAVGFAVFKTTGNQLAGEVISQDHTKASRRRLNPYAGC